MNENTQHSSKNKVKVFFDGKEMMSANVNNIEFSGEKEKCNYCNRKYKSSKLYDINYKKIHRKICEKCLIATLKLKRKNLDEKIEKPIQIEFNQRYFPFDITMLCADSGSSDVKSLTFFPTNRQDEENYILKIKIPKDTTWQDWNLKEKHGRKD